MAKQEDQEEIQRVSTGSSPAGEIQGEKLEKPIPSHPDVELSGFEHGLEGELNVTEEDLAEAKVVAGTLSLEAVRQMMTDVLAGHERDPNFPNSVITKIREFLGNEDIFENPIKHEDLIWEMKLEAALITNNSPYAEVRAVVDNKDDPSTPCSTIRAWTLGCAFSIFLAFVNQLFSIRQPPIYIESNVAQLLVFPLGKAWEKFMPDWRFTLFGTEHRLNPGRFNKKEHMLIAIMATTAKSLPYTQYVIWTQVLPQYFNQQYARSFGYQILIGLSTNFIGYGLAGLTRRFLVYPAYCIWPASLVTIALNSALHNEMNVPVMGPFKKMFTMSRYRFFMWAFCAMFVWFWFPNWIFQALTYFSWMTWIAPNNLNLNILTGFQNGMGLLNPWPTFDWNVLLYNQLDPLMIPAFSTFNIVGGSFVLGFVIVAVYCTNTWQTGYFPINSNKVFDHFGEYYNVTRALDDRGLYDHDKYVQYSAAYLGAANAMVYFTFFCTYAATISYIILFHRHSVAQGFKNLWRSLRRRNTQRPGDAEVHDVHFRLMKAYPEVSEYWYLAVLLVAAACGFAGIAGWPTYTTLGVVPYGVALAMIFVVPVGIVKAMTGIEVTLNVLAEFIGGIWANGNALAMNFFKSYGYVTVAHAIYFSNDLKLAHYLKIPPRHTFAAQMTATLISTFVCTGVLQYQLTIEGICTDDAPLRFYCPGNNTFFTAAVLWGTIGPIKVFGANGQYALTLLGWPIGFLTPILFWLLIKKFPTSRFLRKVHPVAIFAGSVSYSPYSFSYMWPSVPIAWLSWVYIRGRYLALWAKYNFVLSASFSAGVAIAAIIMLFTVQWFEITIDWWGNTQPFEGCEGTACTLRTLAEGERFYPWWNGNIVPAP
ncbi:OPT oligopeptide transporter [Xylariomycetidae sp. FL2044]|nr:OPT oligopeptide transporter [Xylariomycetidae sp. FL2044]